MPLPLMVVWKVSFSTPTSASGCVLLRRFVAQAHSTVKQNLPWAVQSFAHIVGGDRACRPAQVVSEASSRDEEIVRHGGIEGPSKLLGLAIAESKPKSEKFFLSWVDRLPPMSIERASGGSSPIDVFDRVLDKGIVIDAWVRLFLVGIDLITVEARVVVASITTCLQFSEAVGISPERSSAAMAARPSTFPASAEVASDAAATRHDNGGPRDSTNGDRRTSA